jgi:GTPase SAR1 family protein
MILFKLKKYYNNKMKIISNELSKVPKAPCDVDNLDDLPYIPRDPLPKKSFAMLIVGAPGSGKTNLLLSLLMTKGKKRYYYKFFDKIYLMSGSLATLPKKFVEKLPKEQVFTEFKDEYLVDTINGLKDGPNFNNLLVLDDVIRSLSRSKNLSKVFLNRRHITHNCEEDGNGGLSIMVTSQKFNLMPLEFRNAMDTVILFKSSNGQELKAIKDELMVDLSPEIQNRLLKEAWKEKYSFLMIKPNNDINNKYFIKFDKVEFDDEDLK